MLIYGTQIRLWVLVGPHIISHVFVKLGPNVKNVKSFIFFLSSFFSTNEFNCVSQQTALLFKVSVQEDEFLTVLELDMSTL